VIVRDLILLKPESKMIVRDNKGSLFKTLITKHRNVEAYDVSYYTVIDSNINDYELFINGEKVTLP